MMMKYRGPYEESVGSSSAEETALRRSLPLEPQALYQIGPQ